MGMYYIQTLGAFFSPFITWLVSYEEGAFYTFATTFVTHGIRISLVNDMHRLMHAPKTAK